ncbi:DNA alkylation repair protein [Nioella sediminis]|jgi:3-methyladenine DNA glycosylase AlkD|uniref:DNA alkylation repair protein n=1 Tax=Nioella sediminis TaxID=1912092 RepID=UPI0008FD8FD1|nr:DNA alkylation repair protein [Nioella sediminis]TBX29329.1 DNA alkylation repair protein [Roseovarius sp. JS7-11]
MTPQDALAALEAQADPDRATQMRAYHKIDRPYLGLSNEVANRLAQEWRRALPLSDRLALADALWQTNIFEARITAAKLLVQARIRPEDNSTWQLIQSWLPDFDSWAIADAVAMAGQRRLTADPTRLDTVEGWTTSDHLWTKRAALVFTLPWTKPRHPKPQELAARELILGWAAAYTEDPEWFIQKAVAWWLRDLSKKDPERTSAFLAEHGQKMKPFARKEAAKYLP